MSSSTTRTLALLDDQGRPTPTRFDLPRVTEVIKATLAAPNLIEWTYRRTVDSIAGAIGVLQGTGLDDDSFWETLGDADLLDEWLQENRIRPIDVRDERASEGHRAHEFLAFLAQQTLSHGPEKGKLIANAVLEESNSTAFSQGVASWWLAESPQPVASEIPLVSLTHRYAGTCDLVWRDSEDELILTDLKTRRAGIGVQLSDEIQVTAYIRAYEEMRQIPVYRGSVLVACDDATFDEQDVSVDEEVFLRLRELYRMIRGL